MPIASLAPTHAISAAARASVRGAIRWRGSTYDDESHRAAERSDDREGARAPGDGEGVSRKDNGLESKTPRTRRTRCRARQIARDESRHSLQADNRASHSAPKVDEALARHATHTLTIHDCDLEADNHRSHAAPKADVALTRHATDTLATHGRAPRSRLCTRRSSASASASRASPAGAIVDIRTRSASASAYHASVSPACATPRARRARPRSRGRRGTRRRSRTSQNTRLVGSSRGRRERRARRGGWRSHLLEQVTVRR